MKLILGAGVLAFSALAQTSGGHIDAAKPFRLAQSGVQCFRDGEETSPNSQTKICYYRCLGNRVAITVPAYQVCPINIWR